LVSVCRAWNATHPCASRWEGFYWVVEEGEGLARGVEVVGVFDGHQVAVGVGVGAGGGGGGAGAAEEGVGEFDHRVHGGDFDFVAGLGIDDAAEVVEGGLEGLGEVGFAVVAASLGQERDPGLDVGLDGPLQGFGGLDVEVSGEVDEVGVDVGEEVEAVSVFGGEEREGLRNGDFGLWIGGRGFSIFGFRFSIGECGFGGVGFWATPLRPSPKGEGSRDGGQELAGGTGGGFGHVVGLLKDMAMDHV
jgi:hypothetical protein